MLLRTPDAEAPAARHLPTPGILTWNRAVYLPYPFPLTLRRGYMERVVLLDEAGNANGTADKTEVHHTRTPLHLAFSCYVFNGSGQFLSTRRAESKRTFPGLWADTCSGHPLPGEPMPSAVLRRLRQDLGISSAELMLVLPQFRYQARMTNGVMENELCPVYAAYTDATLDPDPAEVAEVHWVEWEEFSAAVQSGRQVVAPWCALQLAELVTLGPQPLEWIAADTAELPQAALATQAMSTGNLAISTGPLDRVRGYDLLNRQIRGSGQDRELLRSTGATRPSEGTAASGPDTDSGSPTGRDPGGDVPGRGSVVGPVSDFCAALDQLRASAGLSMESLARELGFSRAQTYDILNGQITRPPDWDRFVHPLVAACTGGDAGEVAEWRRRHAVLVGVYEELSRLGQVHGDELSGTSQLLGGRYVLSGLLGRGSMGQVFAATDRDSGARVAVKVLHPELVGDPGMVARFIQEGRVLRSVSGPGTVRVLDLIAEGQTLAIVMEHASGYDLRRYLRAKVTLPPAEAAGLAVQLLSGLATVHAAGVVHGDLKPENLLLDASADQTLKLTDFGVARLADNTSLTKQSILVGTPEYMAPEVAEGTGAGTGADLYSAGVVLYEMLCGRTPFAGGPPMAVLRRHADMAPPPVPGLPHALWDQLSRMLAKDPAARPGSAAEAASALASQTATLAPLPALPPMAEPDSYQRASVPLGATSPGADGLGPGTALQRLLTPALSRLKTYREWRESLAGAAERLRDRLAAHGLEALAERAGQAAHSARSDRLRVAFTGGFKSGKSSLANALLGSQTLTVAPYLTSALVVVVEWSAESYAEISTGEDPPSGATVLTAESLSDYLEDPRKAGDFRYARIGTDLELCAQGLVLTDTPGSGTDPRSELLSVQALRSADAVIVAHPVFSPFSASEISLAERAHALAGDRTFFALTHLDQVDETTAVELAAASEQVIDSRLRRDVELFAVSSRVALEAKQDADPELFAASGLARLEETLAGALLENAARPRLLGIADELLTQIRLARSAAAADRTGIIDEIRLRQQLEKARHASWQVITTEAGTVSGIAATMTAEFYRSLASQLAVWSGDLLVTDRGSLNPMRTADQVRSAAQEVTDYLGRRAEREVARWATEELARFLQAQLSRLQQELTSQFADVPLDLSPVLHFGWPGTPGDLLGQDQAPSTGIARKICTDFIAAAIPVTSGTGLLAAAAEDRLLARGWSKATQPELVRQVVASAQHAVAGNAITLRHWTDESVRECYERLWRSIDQRLTDQVGILLGSPGSGATRQAFPNSGFSDFLEQAESDLSGLTAAIRRGQQDG